MSVPAKCSNLFLSCTKVSPGQGRVEDIHRRHVIKEPAWPVRNSQFAKRRSEYRHLFNIPLLGRSFAMRYCALRAEGCGVVDGSHRRLTSHYLSSDLLHHSDA